MISSKDLIAKFQYAIDNNWGYIWGTAGTKWTQARQDAATREMTVKYGQKWVGHYVADCSGLFSWAFKQLGGYMYHGSDTMYRKYCTVKGDLKGGKRTDGGELLPGTGVFTWKEADKKYGHVGLYIGGGKVIEANSTQKGVIVSNVSEKRWTNWGELKDVSYDGGDTPVPETKPTIRRGDEGPYVALAQAELINRGYDLGSWGADGKFGKATETAVKQFQRDWGLAVDGIVGPATWEKLDTAPVTQLYTVHVPHLPEVQADAVMEKYAGAYKTLEG